MKPDFYKIEGPLDGTLVILARPRGDEWLRDEIKSWVDAEIDAVVSLLTSSEIGELGLKDEAMIANELGIHFINYPIPDYDVPVSSSTFRRLVDELSYLLSTGKSIGIHCRQSVGRSSLLAASLLTRFNVTVDEGFRKIREARGISVPDTAEQRQWVATFSDAAFKRNNAEHHHVS